MRALLLLSILLLAPTAQACDQFTPYVQFVFPDKEPCTVTATGGYDGCEPLPARNESRTYDGYILWYWDVDQCSTEQGYLQGDMVFTFSRSELSPDWMDIEFEPEQIVVGLAEYYDPTTVQIDQAQNRIYSEQKRDVSVTFTNARDPTPEEMQDLVDRDMAARFFLKVLGQGDGTADAFGITQFVFDAGDSDLAPVTEAPVDQEAPGVPLAFLLVALAGFAARRR